MGSQQSAITTTQISPYSYPQLDPNLSPQNYSQNTYSSSKQTVQNIIFPKQQLKLSEEHRQFIIEKCKQFSFFSNLPQNKLDQLSKKFVICLSNDQWLFKEGSYASYFFIISQGFVDVIKKGHLIRKLGRGDCFGQMAILYGIKRSSSIRIIKQFRTKNVYFALHKNDFKQAVEYINPQKNNQILSLLANHSAFDYLTYRDKLGLAQASVKINYKNGQRILSKFDQPYCLFLIRSGNVKLNFPNKREIALNPLDLFGYYGCNKIQYSATSVGQTQTYAISKQCVDKILKHKIKYLYLLYKVRYLLLNHPRLAEVPKNRIEQLTFLFTFKYIVKQQPLFMCHSSINKIIIPISCTESERIQVIGLQEMYQYNGSNSNGNGNGNGNSNKRYAFDFIASKSGHYACMNSQLFMRYVEDQKFIIDEQQFKSFNFNRSTILATFPKKSKSPTHILCKQNKFNINYTLQLTNPIKNPQKAHHLLTKFHTLSTLSCLFIQNIYYFTQKPTEYILAKQYIRGTTIKQNILNIGIIPFYISKFYIACMVIMLESLHQNYVSCGTLQIDNFRIDQDGYIWLCQFQMRFPMDEIYCKLKQRNNSKNENGKGNQNGNKDKQEYNNEAKDKQNKYDLKINSNDKQQNQHTKRNYNPYKYFKQDFKRLCLICYELLVGQKCNGITPPTSSNKQNQHQKQQNQQEQPTQQNQSKSPSRDTDSSQLTYPINYKNKQSKQLLNRLLEYSHECIEQELEIQQFQNLINCIIYSNCERSNSGSSGSGSDLCMESESKSESCSDGSLQRSCCVREHDGDEDNDGVFGIIGKQGQNTSQFIKINTKIKQPLEQQPQKNSNQIPKSAIHPNQNPPAPVAQPSKNNLQTIKQHYTNRTHQKHLKKWQKLKQLPFFKGIDWKSLQKKQIKAPILPGFMSISPLVLKI